MNLSSGNCVAAITQYDNFAGGNSLADGFVRVGEGNFTGLAFGCSNQMFCDVTSDDRTPNYTLEVAPVPVPAALPLILAGIVALGVARRRRRILN